METFKLLGLKLGEEADTGNKWIDAAGVTWPVYRKRLAIDALVNAGTKVVAHGVAAIKLNAPITPVKLSISNAANSARVSSVFDNRITNIVTDADSVDITNTGDLTTYNTNGAIEIEYCKTTDNV